MRLGTRVTVVTTVLVAGVLAASGVAALQSRRADLEADLSREAHEIAAALSTGLEPLEAGDAASTLEWRAYSARENDEIFQLEILRVGDERRTDDPAWLLLMQGAEILDAPVGRIFDSATGARSYAMAVPLYDAAGLELPRRHPARKAVAMLGMRRDASYIGAEMKATARRLFPLFVLVVVVVGIVVSFAFRQTVAKPLRRLVEGIDAVGEGDLTRVIFAQRDDEIGTIAGRFNAMTGSLREVREEGERGAEARLALEARLRQSEKLATMGQMAAEIAHEVGTPLNVIGGRARAIGKIIGRQSGEASSGGVIKNPTAEIAKNAGIIGGEVERITKIIRQVLDFSRKRGPTSTRVRVPAVVSEAIGFLAETTRRQGIVVEVHAPPADLPDVPGDPDQIQQVCLNLLMNAVHAMPTGGTLRVATERVVRRKGELDLAAPAEYVVLEISDSGSGIPEAHRDKIFEPFFTTRDEGQGTGLGLAVSNGIVKDHDGWIEVESPRAPAGEEGGAVFRVYLPTGVALAAASPFDTSPGLPVARS
ncbi:MAG TPA: ATP-binding protein [Polyangia bacterium]|jgi:signal transduction histidine kinase|nr:ATP-binding protein [Polyangia bacterium]